MYSFGPLPRQKRSGRVIGTHQKVDRIARRHLSPHLDDRLAFPSINDILHFEGSRGPDGIKLKSPGQDEPEHFIDPDNITANDPLLLAIADHQENLTAALLANDLIRAAYEAAWVAHAVGDGLTPAHHDSYYDQLAAIGKNKASRGHQVRSKVMMTGDGSAADFVKNNWKYWGAKGVLTTHTLFEAGMATTAKPLRFKKAQLTDIDFDALDKSNFETLYLDMIQKIANLHMYEEFKRKGWTRQLARQTMHILMPTIITATVLVWYDAYQSALKRSDI